MSKKYITTFSISVIVLATIAIIMLMLMTPQEAAISSTSTLQYEPINQTNYQYENTKNLTKEALVQQYTITGNAISTFAKYKQYVAGNSNPFTPSGDVTNVIINSLSNSTLTNSTTTK